MSLDYNKRQWNSNHLPTINRKSDQRSSMSQVYNFFNGKSGNFKYLFINYNRNSRLPSIYKIPNINDSKSMESLLKKKQSNEMKHSSSDYFALGKPTQLSPIISPKRKPLMGIRENALKKINNRKITIPKSDILVQQIKNAFKSHYVFSQLLEEATDGVIDLMEKNEIPMGTVIIKEGDKGDYCYYIEEGKFAYFEKSKGNGITNKINKGEIFGELALIYDCPRTGTVQALSNSTVWKIDRLTFRSILTCISEQERNKLKEFLKTINIFSSLTDIQINQIASIVKSEEYNESVSLVNESTWKDRMIYIIHNGHCKCVKPGFEKVLGEKDVVCEELFNGKEIDYNVVTIDKVECYSLNYIDFLRVIGNLHKLNERNRRFKALRNIAIFQYLKDDDLDDIDDAFEEIHFNNNEYIIKAKDVGDKFYIIKSGKCKVTYEEEINGEIHEKDIEILEPGDSIYYLYYRWIFWRISIT